MLMSPTSVEPSYDMVFTGRVPPFALKVKLAHIAKVVRYPP